MRVFYQKEVLRFVCIQMQDGGLAYCLAIVKSEDINIIGREY